MRKYLIILPLNRLKTVDIWCQNIGGATTALLQMGTNLYISQYLEIH
jgi:hypothetical protein